MIEKIERSKKLKDRRDWKIEKIEKSKKLKGQKDWKINKIERLKIKDRKIERSNSQPCQLVLWSGLGVW